MSILDDIDVQIENTDEVIKNSIIKWIKDNVKSIQENKLNFDFNTTPITVNYDGNIEFKTNITSFLRSELKILKQSNIITMPIINISVPIIIFSFLIHTLYDNFIIL